VVSTTTNEVLAELNAGGRIRPRGQSTLALPTCLGIDAIPFKVDFDSKNQSQTLFGIESIYLRHHMGDASYMREWSMHRMLARFGLPHLRTRAARFYINSQYKGLYEIMEAPDQSYVFARGFPDVNLANHSLFKVKTSSRGCGSYSAQETTEAQPSNESTLYSFDRGTHRDKIEVTPGDWAKCISEFYGMMGKEHVDAVSAYVRYNQNCGEMLVSEGLIDRDLGQSSWDPIMVSKLRRSYSTYSHTLSLLMLHPSSPRSARPISSTRTSLAAPMSSAATRIWRLMLMSSSGFEISRSTPPR
jgi:hypothetical protein